MHTFEFVKNKAFGGLIISLFALPSFAAELLVVDQPFCPYCERFNAEIAPAYPNTEEGSKAPIVRVQLNKPWPETYAFVEPATMTPSFILIDNGEEVDRIEGYPGDEHFWFLLNLMLDKLR